MGLLDDIQAATHPDAKDGQPGRALLFVENATGEDAKRLLDGRASALREAGLDFQVDDSADLRDELERAFKTVIDSSN